MTSTYRFLMLLAVIILTAVPAQAHERCDKGGCHETFTYANWGCAKAHGECCAAKAEAKGCCGAKEHSCSAEKSCGAEKSCCSSAESHGCRSHHHCHHHDCRTHDHHRSHWKSHHGCCGGDSHCAGESHGAKESAPCCGGQGKSLAPPAAQPPPAN